MSSTENEMTLIQFFKVIGKSWKKLLVYALSSIIIATAVMSVVNVCTDTRHASAVITSGNAEDNTLNMLAQEKNEVLASAVAELFATDAARQEKIISALTPNLTVTAPAETKDTKTDATSVQFLIDIEEDKSLGLSANQYKALADGVTRGFIKKLSSIGELERLIAFDYNIDSNISELEYIQVAYDVTDMLKNLRGIVKASLSTMTYYNSAAGDFKGTNGRSLNEIVASLDSYIDAADRVTDTIVSLRLSNKNAAVSAKDYLKNAYDIAVIDAKRYSDFAAETDKELQYYKDLKITLSVTDKNNVLVQDFAKIYNELTLRNETAQKNAAAAQKIASVLELRYNAYKDLTPDQLKPSTETDGTTTKLKNLYEVTSSVIEEYNAVAAEYESSSYAAYLSRSTNAKIYVSRVLSVKIMLIVDAALLVISLIVAYAQTFDKMKRNGSL